jgi:hypothetical protein
LLKVDPGMSGRVVIVAPESRKRKLNEILKRSHFMGHPLYMENKLVYLYAETVVDIYDLMTFGTPSITDLLAEIEKYAVKAIDG